jgi:APA family basic amino acid/polyamine antiporter
MAEPGDGARPGREPSGARPARRVADAVLVRSLGSPALFAVLYTTLASALYFSLGAVAGRALGLTPAVFLAAALFFVATLMTYVEGASLHQERAGATVFARYAFNELVSFVAGWAILLDLVILIALAVLAATNYASAFWAPLGHGWAEAVTAALVIAAIAILNVIGPSPRWIRQMISLTAADLVLQVTIIVLGLALVFDVHELVDPISLGESPTWATVFALVIAASAASTGLDASSGLAGEVAIGRRGLKRLVAARIGTVLVLYVGISLVALAALPVSGGRTELGDASEDAPLLGVVTALTSGSALPRYVVGGVGALVLIAAANAAMLGLARLGYSLATNRQIPSAIGRLHRRRSTPWVVIVLAAVMALALVLPGDLDFLIGIYAFGAMLALTIAHLSVCVLRYREPDRDRPYVMPLSVRVGPGRLPLPAVLGALLSVAGWVSVILLHVGARMVGLLWMAFGLTLYVAYRLVGGKPLLKRVTVPAIALARERSEAEYGSMLVPLLGTPLDDDIIQTAGRLAGHEREDEGEPGAMIEALWIFEVPLSLPLDAALPEDQLKQARRALAHAKEVGEEYEGVEVATATVRARRAGQAIVEEARRRGVEVIVLGAEEPSRIRGGALLGGVGRLDNYIGDVTRYVVEKAPCRVILTAPPSEEVSPSDNGRHGASGTATEGPGASSPSPGRPPPDGDSPPA